jgi:Fe-S-cluster containining protein
MAPPSNENEHDEHGDGDPQLAADVKDGLSFCHMASQNVRADASEVALTVMALVEELCAEGIVTPAALEAGRPAAEAAETAGQMGRLKVRLLPDIDKYSLSGPDVPCEELIPLCRGRCCTLHFPLGRQDLEERVVKWNYLQPYTIRQRQSDLYCVHNDPSTRGCTVYRHRPAICRTYDCRNDKRIWVDFDKRIPVVDPELEPRDVPVPHGPAPTH